MADRLEVNLDGQVLNAGSVLDTISRRTIALDLAEDKAERQPLTADETTEANVTLTVPLPAVVLITNRDPDNILLIGPAVAGPAIQRFIEVLPSTTWNIALFVLDSTATLRYKSLVAPVNFDLRAWPI